LVVPLGGQNFGDAEIAIKTALADKNSDIRESTYTLLSACLQRFSYPDLKSFETRIVKHLLTGYSDQTPETRAKIPEYLNICGESRRKLDDEMKSLNN
jgi:hypothetical protein